MALKDIAEIEFSSIVDIVILTEINQLRIILKEGSFIDYGFPLRSKIGTASIGKEKCSMTPYIDTITLVIRNGRQ